MEEKSVSTISNENIQLNICAQSGFITSLSIRERSLFKQPLRPNYYRAMVDNDRGFASFNPKQLLSTIEGFQWKHVPDEMRLIDTKIKDVDANIVVTSRYEHKLFEGDIVLEYTVHPNGRLKIKHAATPLQRPYRIGMSAVLTEGYCNFTWYGRGPHENYCDRKTSADVAVYHGGLDDLQHNYLRPQENGNRTDVRYLNIRDAYGSGFTIQDCTSRHFGFSVHPYSQNELDECEHIHDLPCHDEVYLQIDALQCGVGGDLPGIALLKKGYYIEEGKTYEQEFEIF